MFEVSDYYSRGHFLVVQKSVPNGPVFVEVRQISQLVRNSGSSEGELQYRIKVSESDSLQGVTESAKVAAHLVAWIARSQYEAVISGPDMHEIRQQLRLSTTPQRVNPQDQVRERGTYVATAPRCKV